MITGKTATGAGGLPGGGSAIQVGLPANVTTVTGVSFGVVTWSLATAGAFISGPDVSLVAATYLRMSPGIWHCGFHAIWRLLNLDVGSLTLSAILYDDALVILQQPAEVTQHGTIDPAGQQLDFTFEPAVPARLALFATQTTGANADLNAVAGNIIATAAWAYRIK